jgi:hypothetical protein
MFYSINAVEMYKDNDKWYAVIASSGKEYICNLTYDEVNKLIQENF